MGHKPSQGWGLLEERGPNGELLARHVHGSTVDELVLSELNGAVYYYHQDHLNSTIAVTDDSGNVVEQYRYDVYGQPFFYGPDGSSRGHSALRIRFLFTGREWLGTLSLYDYRHRAYSPSLGRFLQMDPLRLLGSSNLYDYCAGAPTGFLDPYGLDRLAVLGTFINFINELLRIRERCEQARGDLEALGDPMMDTVRLTTRTALDLAPATAGGLSPPRDVKDLVNDAVVDAVKPAPSEMIPRPHSRVARDADARNRYDNRRGNQRRSYTDREGRHHLLDLDTGQLVLIPGN